MVHTTIYLIRHGEIENPNRLVFYGSSVDLPLSRAGIHQMKSLGESLKEKGIVPDVIITSSLLRARESAGEILKAFGAAPIVVEDKLKDTFSPGLEKLAPQKQATIENIYTYNGPEIQGIEIESPHKQAERILQIVSEACLKYPEKTIFIVSHGDPTTFAIWRLTHPGEEFPSVRELKQKGIYLDKGEARKIVLNGSREILVHERIPYIKKT